MCAFLAYTYSVCIFSAHVKVKLQWISQEPVQIIHHYRLDLLYSITIYTFYACSFWVRKVTMNLSRTSTDDTLQKVRLKLYSVSVYTLMHSLFENTLVPCYIFSTCKSKSKVTMNLSRTSSDDASQNVKIIVYLLSICIHFLCMLSLSVHFFCMYIFCTYKNFKSHWN